MLPGLTFSNPLVLLLLPLVLAWAAWLWMRDTGNLSPARHRLALALRLLIMSALVLVLSGATWQQPVTRQATIFVADLSASVAGLRDAQVSFINRALKYRARDDVAGIVVVGGDALVEQPIAGLNAFAGFQSVVDRNATNLEAGLNLAGALFPAGYRKRVVLLTDGQQNLGDALGAAHLLHDEGVRLDVVPLAPAAGPEALVTGVDVHSSFHRGEKVPLTVNMHSNVAQSATVDIFDGGRLLQSTPVLLGVGDTALSLTLPALGQGFHRLRAVLHPTRDTVADNNEGDAFTRVTGAPHVLVAEGLPGEANVVVAALRARGMTVKQIAAVQIEPSLSYLSGFDAVMLVDVPAPELDPQLLDPASSPLSAYVDGGGGLVVIGGPNSYGVGGYTDTALDDVLPVSMKLPKRKDTPTVAVALIIEDLETASNVNVSKIAGEGVIRLLTPNDQVAVNDANGTDVAYNGWAVPLQYVLNKTAINRAIDVMNPTDPASYIPSLTAAYRTLRRANAQIKHIILLGDGDAEDNYFPLVSQIRKAGITVSTVATGGGSGGFGADYGTMQNIARWGGGQYHQADNVSTIPQIFLTETKQIARTGIVEGRFVPEIFSDSPIIRDLPGVPLNGYVATTPKPAGQQVLMHMTRHGNDPVLAQWQYGLGRSVAWTSDAQGRWSGNLIANGQGNQLWANMVSWVLPAQTSSNLTFASSVSGGQAHLTVTTNGLPLDAQVTARVESPDGHASTVTLPPTAPGQYEADIPASSPGSYLVGVRALANNHVRAQVLTGLVVPYAAEFRTFGLNTHLVRDAAAAGSGSLLSQPAQAFAANLPSVYASQPLTTALLVLALLLLPLDVAVRRVLVGLAELREGWALLTSRSALQPVAAGAAAAPLTMVRERRVRRRERIAAAAEREQPGGQRSRPLAPGAEPRRARVAEPAPSDPAAAKVVPAPASPQAAAGQGLATSRLLEAKRKRRGNG